MFSRKIRWTLPIAPSELGTFHSYAAVSQKDKKRKKRQATQYNRKHGSKNLSPLYVGEKVWLIDLRVYGEISEIDKSLNFYWVQTYTSKVRRNRFHSILAPYCSEKFDTVSADKNVCIPIAGGNNSIEDECLEESNVIENYCRAENDVLCEDENVQMNIENQQPARQRRACVV